MYINMSLILPYFSYSKELFNYGMKISKNLFLEIDVSYVSKNLLEFKIHYKNNEYDHNGLYLTFCLFGLEANINFLDNRHKEDYESETNENI